MDDTIIACILGTCGGSLTGVALTYYFSKGLFNGQRKIVATTKFREAFFLIQLLFMKDL